MKKVNTFLITEAASSIAAWKSSVLDPQKLGAAALLINNEWDWVFTKCFSQNGRAK